MRRRFSTLLGFLILAGAAAVAAQDEETSREFCAACHDEAVEAFTAGVHGRLMAARSQEMLDRSCASCHGPVETHLEELTVESINRWPAPAACLDCHPDRAGAMRKATPGHERNGVACLDCHVSGHAAPAAEPLLVADTRRLCGDCHGDVRATFARPFLHREGSEAAGCESCHAVHGGGDAGRFTMLGNGGVCVSCHTDKAGPFIFPHAAREVDGCVDCHEPHGSSNPRQLVRRTVLSLCLECHANVPDRSFHDFTQARFRACHSCHRAIHGSNSDPTFLDE